MVYKETEKNQDKVSSNNSLESNTTTNFNKSEYTSIRQMEEHCGSKLTNNSLT
tara:strand:+ start:15490 stop:15648 length:159 start_codon:yes stop_codon:yes gene_type:complete